MTALRKSWHFASLGLGLVLLVIGHGLGLFVAPEEAMMGNVGRILYVHVPTAWVALVTYLIAFVLACGSLWTSRRGWDAGTEAAVEVGVLLNALLLCQGSIWAKPTWDTWWTWDPRLTTTAIMVVTFVGVLVLRSLVHRPSRRAMATAVATIIAFVNVPIVYKSVEWWNSLHQEFSSPDTVSDPMILPLRIAAFGMLFISIGLIGWRASIGVKRLAAEDTPDALPDAPKPLELS